MADNQEQRRPQSTQYTWIWMTVALVLVGVFLVWLAVTSEPTSVAIVEDVSGEESMIPAVPLDQFAINPDDYAGQEVRLTELQVASRMGTEAVWINLPTGLPYLIKLDTAALSEADTIRSGDVVTVAGTVHMMTDSVLAAWQAAGAIQSEGQLAEAQFATSFLEARVARRTGGAQDGEGAAGQ